MKSAIQSRNVLFIVMPIIISLLSTNPFLYVNLYLLGIIFLLFTIILKKGRLKRKILYVLLPSLLFCLINIRACTERDYISFIFILLVYFCVVHNYFLQINFSLVKNIQYVFFITVGTFVSFILAGLFMNHEYRFMGWAGSPTTLAIYCTYLAYIFSLIVPNKRCKIIVYIFLLIIVFFTGTRSGLVLVIIISLIDLTNFKILSVFNKKGVLLVLVGIIIIFIIFNDLIYNLLYSMGLNEALDRYSGGEDYSYLTRVELKLSLLNLISSSSIVDLLFGNGIGTANSILNKYNTGDSMILAHNDILKLIVDWGAIFFVCFIYSLVSIFKYIHKPLIPLLIYIISFMHNMMFDHLSIIYLFSIYYICINKDELNLLNQYRARL